RWGFALVTRPTQGTGFIDQSGESGVSAVFAAPFPRGADRRVLRLRSDGRLGVVMMPGDDVLTKPVARRIEVFTGTGRRRKWSAEAKAKIVAESYAASVGQVADRHGLAKNQLFSWRREGGRRRPQSLVRRLSCQ